MTAFPCLECIFEQGLLLSQTWFGAIRFIDPVLGKMSVLLRPRKPLLPTEFTLSVHSLAKVAERIQMRRQIALDVGVHRGARHSAEGHHPVVPLPVEVSVVGLGVLFEVVEVVGQVPQRGEVVHVNERVRGSNSFVMAGKTRKVA